MAEYPHKRFCRVCGKQMQRRKNERLAKFLDRQACNRVCGAVLQGRVQRANAVARNIAAIRSAPPRPSDMIPAQPSMQITEMPSAELERICTGPGQRGYPALAYRQWGRQ